jgi:hypothetical protein
MREGFVIANFRHVADGFQEGQFAIGERRRAASLADLDPVYRQLLDRPITQTLGVIGPDGRASLTPMWFDYEDDKILVNTASHRPKCEWIRKNPRLTSLIVNPDNPYHWVQIKHTVETELREWEPGGEYVTRQLDRMWTRYTGNPPPYGLRDPKIDEKRVLFVCRIDRIATFGRPEPKVRSAAVAGGSAGELLLDRGSQRRQGELNGIPNAMRRDIFVVVAINVSGAGHLSPGDVRMPGLERV